MNHEQEENNPRSILLEEVCNNKRKYNDQILDFYKLIASLSAAMLSLLAALYQKTGTPSCLLILCYQVMLTSLLVSLISALTALYGKAYSHLDKVKKIVHAVAENQNNHAAALKSLQDTPIMFEPKIFAWSHYICFGSFLLSQVLLAFFASLKI
jgi:flagellar biosynthesis protein FliQ